jgi:hypothetical protein
MSFESLAYRYTFSLDSFPSQWLPLIHLYDPDLPLFPIYYFHALLDSTKSNPNETDRVFGYVEKLNLDDAGNVTVGIIVNKDLKDPGNIAYGRLAINEVKERLGINNPVTIDDVRNAFTGTLSGSNIVLIEIWKRVVSSAYGDMLPFGRLWDEVLGLARFVSSWNPPNGRKGEFIQTHYFASKFGVRINTDKAVHRIDFFLLPTIHELLDQENQLTLFPRFSELLQVARQVQKQFCSTITTSGLTLSKFNNPYKGRFTSERMQQLISQLSIPQTLREAAIECFNAFDKGNQRPMIFFMMLDDLRQHRLRPASLNAAQCGSIYDGLSRSYQAPKVIAIYAQQSFSNESAVPIDTWVKTFLKWPLNMFPKRRTKQPYLKLFEQSQRLGKVERLIWVTAQARKVHSSACNDALWCLKYGSPGAKESRGANPFACNICLVSIRRVCPAYAEIRGESVSFNRKVDRGRFNLETTAHNNTAPDQYFIRCTGTGTYGEMVDEFSPADDPTGFAPFPGSEFSDDLLTVEEFVTKY